MNNIIKNMNQAHKITVLRSYGFLVCERDPNRGQPLPGKFMVAEPLEDNEEYDTQDTSSDIYCTVGDNLDELVNKAFDLVSQFSYFDAVCADVMAGGVGLLHTDGTGAGPILA